MPAPYAASDQNSRGRRYLESDPNYRGQFQRDRDRIIHSAAFRRLEYKTQVFINHEGDLFRTRLTHSLEVAQIGRAIARALDLNEDLTEAIALAHDLGHTPFGHAGQDALNACMKPFGGFEHNIQSLRVVNRLEKKYAQFDGLNLTFETREGILKHCSKLLAAQFEVGQRFLSGEQPSLEAQLCNLADEIAYNNHDVDDGLRAHLIELDSLRQLDLFGSAFDEVQQLYGNLEKQRLIHEVIRRMINRLVIDLIETSSQRIRTANPSSIEEVRTQPQPLIGFSHPVWTANIELKQFLRQNLYQHFHVRRMTSKAQTVVTGLFEAFFHDPLLLPPSIQYQINLQAETSWRARAIADYLAGMTDRYAFTEYARIFEPEYPA